jgi:hypothetical protein
MATFIHIFAEEDRSKILRGGIKVVKQAWRENNGVFLSAQTEDYSQTHQWYREVQRLRGVPKLAARVRIPDEEEVLIGKYNEQHIEVTAAKAIAMTREHKGPAGLEVILPRSISPAEILKTYRLPKAVGWRYHPGAKGTRPCGCSYCQRGEPGGRKLRDRYEQGL